jgi:DNA-binding MarR family transcriptional regulator
MNYAQIPDDILPKVRTWSAMQLAIWADVHTMCKAGMAYYRTNEQLAERFGADDRTVRRVVSQLIACGAITAEQDGKRRILQSVTDFAERKRTKRSPDQSVPGPTGPRTNQSEKEDQLVRDGGPTGPEMGDQSVLQVESIVEIEVEHVVERSAPPKKEATPKDLQTVIDAFVEAGQTSDMGEAFFNYYESIGWRVGKARTPMKDWKASARGWIQRETKYQDESANNGWNKSGKRNGSYFHSSGKYKHPSDVLKDRDIWG